MPEIKKFRLGGAAGYSLIAYGSKTRSGVVYERIELEDKHLNSTHDLTKVATPLNLACTAIDYHHLASLVGEARKHLAMGAA